MGRAAEIFAHASVTPPPAFCWGTVYPDGIVVRQNVSRVIPVYLHSGPNGERREAAGLVRFMEMRRITEDLCEPAPRGFGAWAAVVAARGGSPAICDAPDAWVYDPEDPEDAARHLSGRPPGWVSRVNSAIWGPDIIDLVVCRLTFRGPALRVVGLVDHLGPEWLAEDQPVRVHRSIVGWLASECDGIVPLGSERERQSALLHHCPAGIIADDVAHGLEIQRLLKRPIPPTPPVFVAERAAA